MDSPEGAPLPDTERGHCRPNPANQVVLCDPEAMPQELLCQLGQRVKRSAEERGEEIRQHLSYLAHSLGPSGAPAKGTFHTPLCGSSPTGIPASSRKSSRMPSCPASEHRILHPLVGPHNPLYCEQPWLWGIASRSGNLRSLKVETGGRSPLPVLQRRSVFYPFPRISPLIASVPAPLACPPLMPCPLPAAWGFLVASGRTLVE